MSQFIFTREEITTSTTRHVQRMATDWFLSRNG